MFESLRNWLSIPLKIIPFVRRDGTGEAIYDEAINTKCYAQGKVTLVRDVYGNDVVSQLQLYIDSCVPIKVTDKVSFNGSDYNIKALSPYYDGNTGDISIVVVYL